MGHSVFFLQNSVELGKPFFFDFYLHLGIIAFQSFGSLRESDFLSFLLGKDAFLGFGQIAILIVPVLEFLALFVEIDLLEFTTG